MIAISKKMDSVKYILTAYGLVRVADWASNFNPKF